MKIINATKSVNGQTVKLTPDEIEKDRAELEKRNKEALSESPTWDMFGGIITIGKHKYQVC